MIGAVEVAPGVYVVRQSLGDGTEPRAIAYGPGLEAALATAADVATLDAWAGEVSMARMGSRARGCTYDIELRSHGGPEWAGSYQTPQEARRAAADAIRNGRVPA